MTNIDAKNHPSDNPIENRESLQKWVFDRYKIDALWLILHGEVSIWEKIAQNPAYFSRFISLSGKSKQLLLNELSRSARTGIPFGQNGMISHLKKMNPLETIAYIAGGENFRNIFQTETFQDTYMSGFLGTPGNIVTPLDLCNEVNNKLMRNRGSLIIDHATGGCLLLYIIRDTTGSMKMRIFDPLDFDNGKPKEEKPAEIEDNPANQE